MRLDELDDMFKEALSRVEPPPPPSMDWKEMAGFAKAGAPVVPSVGAGASGLTMRWWMLLGGAVVAGVLWFVALNGTTSTAEMASRQVAEAQREDVRTTA